jgi:hypothetical protein
MPRPLMHDLTQSTVQAFLSEPSHAVLLSGPRGAGKGFLASHIARKLLGDTKADAIYHVQPNPVNISIDQIRGLQGFLSLKKPGKHPIRRVVIIEQAETMGDEAQNALLKVLEEPPADSVFILTSSNASGLRPTIASRVQNIRVLPVSIEQASTIFPGEIRREYLLSSGLLGLLHSLLNDDSHQLVTAIEQAKQLMRSSLFERLVAIDAIAKDKGQIPTLFYALERVISAALSSTNTHEQTNRLVRSLRAIYSANIDLAKSANPKLLLSDLFLSL